MTDSCLIANAFLVRVLEIMVQVAKLLRHNKDAENYQTLFENTKREFAREYITPNGRLLSDTQTAYALAICFDLLSPEQMVKAGRRLSEIIRHNNFKIATGFVGTPFVCEALVRTAHSDVAYAMLLNKSCPSWLYPITMGATTVWERWDSMLSDGSVNNGHMTSFNHFAYGAVGKFIIERLAGLQCMSPGWKKSKFEPVLGGHLSWATAEHMTPYGRIACSWTLTSKDSKDSVFRLTVEVTVPPTTHMEIVLPSQQGRVVKNVGSGLWSSTVDYTREYEWPVKEIPSLLL